MDFTFSFLKTLNLQTGPPTTIRTLASCLSCPEGCLLISRQPLVALTYMLSHAAYGDSSWERNRSSSTCCSEPQPWCASGALDPALHQYLHNLPGMSHLMNKSLNLSPTEAACSCV